MTNAKLVTKKLLSCLLCLCLVLPLFSSAFVPLAAELKAALTVESSAASTTDLSTIQYTSGGYHYYYYQQGATFVNGIGVKTKGGWSTTNLAKQFKDEGYYYPKTDLDLNKGTGSTKDTIKMGFTMTTDPTKAFTKVAISSSESGCTIGSSSQWPAFYRFATSGTAYTVTWNQSNGTDLNQGAGGAYLYFCHTFDTRVGKPLTLLEPREDENTNANYARYLNNNAYADLNQKAGGDYIRVYQTDDALTNYGMHDNHKYVNTTGTTDVSSAIQQLQDTYNQYNNYLVSDRYTTATYNALNTALDRAATVISDFSDFYSSTYTAAAIAPYTQAIIDAANALETTVYFNASTNGGTVSTTSTTLKIGTDTSAKYDFTTNVLADKTYWSFLGWNTVSNATTGSYSMQVGYNTTLYAIFKREFSGHFTYMNANGVATTTNQYATLYNTATSGSFTAPAGVATVNSGGTFNMLGYRADTQAADPTLAVNATITFDANGADNAFRYYAVYSRDNLTLSFDANSGSGAPASQTAKQYLNASGAKTNKEFTIPADVIPTLDAYEFNGWSATKNGAVAYQPGDSLTIDKDTTLFAAWKAAAYDITFDVNGGNALSAMEYTADTTSILPTPTRIGYAFNGWKAMATNGTWVEGDIYIAGTPLNGKSGDITLQAQWTAQDVSYTIYHMNQKVDGSGYEQSLIESNYKAKADSDLTITDFILDNQNGFYYDHVSLSPDGAAYTEATTTVLPDGTRAIYIYYNRESYTVTLEKGTGVTSVAGAGEYLYGAEITVTAVLAEGYEFNGWTGDKTSDALSFTFTVTDDIALTANASVITYTISINGNGADVPVESRTIQYTLTDVITLPELVYEGWTLEGWTVYADGNSVENWAEYVDADAAIGPNLYGNVILIADWSATEYTITFNENGAAELADIDYNIQSTTKLPNAVKYGYMFMGWTATTVDGNWVLNKNYPGGFSINGMYGDVTLDAQFTEIPYTLSFDANGGKVSPTYITYQITNQYNASLPTPTRPGYSFDGWQCLTAKADDLDEQEACDWVVDEVYEAGMDLTGIAGNATFKALWTANDYNLTATVANGIYSGATGDDVITAGVDYTATVAANEGYKLNETISVVIDGKEVTAGKDYTYANGTITVKGTSIVGDVVITVGTTINEYKITYVGVNAGHSFPMTYTIESGEIVIGEAVRDGYRFDGWTGTDIDEMTKQIVIPANSTGDRTFTANWTKSYTVHFETAGGDPITKIVYVAGEDVEIPTPVKDGYKFRYWSVNGAWSEEQLDPGVYTGKSGDVTLTAVFSAPTSYTVEEYFMTTDGTYGNPTSVVYSDGIFVDDTATFEPGTYTGFTLAESGNVLSGTILENGALVLKAYYERNKYNVNVTADANIAEIIGAGAYYYGESVTVTAVPNGGYSIVGWTGDYESDEASIGFTIGTEDVSLSVTSAVIKYNVEFVVDGGEAPEGFEYNPSVTVTLPDIPKAGYTMYWVLAADSGSWKAGQIVPGDYTAMYGDIILTAEWVANTDTPYVLETYFQNIEDDEYAAPVVENLTGTTDTAVVLPVDYEGFTTPAASEQVINGNGETVVKYYYTRNSYTVTYNINDTQDVDTYKFGATIVKPEAPAVGGYRFNGWDKEIAAVMPAENLVYTADLSLITYTVTFSGAMGDAIAPIQYNVTQALTLPQITEPGYSVTWTLTADAGSWTAGEYAPGIYPAGNYGNLSLKAVNTPNPNTEYTVNVSLQNLDGSYAEAVSETKYGTTGEVVAAPEEIEGFIAPVASKLTIKGDGTTVVNYSYKRASFTVDYNVFDKVTTDTYLYEAEIVAPADPVVAGYEFVKWDSEIAATMPAENLTYTAEFKAIEYTVTFDAGEGSVVEEVKYDITMTVELPESKLENFRFVEWQVSEADGNWKVGDVINAAFSGKYGNITVKAVWSEVRADYTVETYFMDLNGNYSDTADKTETMIGLVGNDAVYEMPEVTGFSADTDKSVLEAVILEDGSTVLKAYYSRNQYDVTTAIEGNGAVSITESGKYYYGATVELVVEIKDHYTVGSWTGVEAEGTTASFTMPANNVEVTATVIPVVYTLTVDNADGEDATVIEYTVEDTVTIPDATRTAYTFAGWTLVTANGNWTEADLTVGAELAEKFGNATIKATWTAIEYDLVYDLADGEMPETYYYPAGKYTVESKIVLPVPSKTGYRFKGWVVTAANTDECNWEESFERNATLIGAGRYGNVTLTATWYALDVEVYVEHYLQYTWSDEYILLDKYVDYHAAGTEINIEEEVAKKNPGAYHFEKALVNGEEVETVVIANDGTTSIQIYYLLDEHTVTVNYETPDGVAAPEAYVGTFRYGQYYNVNSPVVEGYNPSSVTVAGRMEFTDVEFTVTYAIATYDVTVNYKYANGSKAAETVVKAVEYGADYSIASPEIAGYTPSLAVVEGTMAGEAITVDVIYGVNTHTLTIHYVYADNSAAAEDYVAELEFGYAYNVKSADVVGHTAESAYVSGTMPDADAEIKVVYTPNTYTVIFRDYDGTDLAVQQVVYGTAATAPADPVRANDDKYSYTFKGWSEDFSNIQGDTVITATYTSTNLSTGEVEGDDEEVDNSFFGKIKAFFQRLIKFLKILFMIT